MGRPLCVAAVLLCLLHIVASLSCSRSPSTSTTITGVTGTITTSGSSPNNDDGCYASWAVSFTTSNYLGSVWSVELVGPNSLDDKSCAVWFDSSIPGTTQGYGDIWGWLVFWNRDADQTYRFATKFPASHYMGVTKKNYNNNIGWCTTTTMYWVVYADYMAPASGAFIPPSGSMPFDVAFITTSAPPSWLTDVFTVNLGVGGCSNLVAWARWSSTSTTPTLTFTLMNTGTSLSGTYTVCLNPDGGDLNYAMSATISTQNIGFTGLNTLTYYDQPSATFSSIPSNPYTYHVGLGLASSCASLGSVGTINARDTALTINLPLLPGSYQTCAAYQGNSFTGQGGSVVIYKPMSYSIAAIIPAVAAKGVTAPFVLKASSLVGASNASASTVKVGFSSTTNCGTPLWQAQPSLGVTWTISTQPTATGVYYLCYTVNSGTNWALIDSSVTLTVIDYTYTTITSIVPSIVGLGTSPTFTLGVSGPVPYGAQVGLGAGGCTNLYFPQTLSASSRLVNFGSLTGFSALASTQLYVCYYDGTSWTQQTGAFITVAGTQTISAVTPNVIPFSGSNPFSLVFSAPAISSQGTWFRLATSGCSGTGAVDRQYTGGPVSFVFPSAGTYTVCYSVNGNSAYSSQGVTINVFSASLSSLSFVGGTVGVIGRSGQSVVVSSGPPVTPNAYVFVDQAACGLTVPAWAISYTTPPLSVPIPKTLSTTSPNLCYTINAGAVNAVLQTSSTMTMISEPSATVVTTSGSTFFVASGYGVSLTATGSQSSGFATMTYAPTGLCNSPTAYFITPFLFLSNGITPVLTIPTSLAGQSVWSVVPCLSYYSGSYVEQTSSVALSVASAQSYSISGMNPSTFVVPTSIVSALFTGAVPTPQTRIALSLDTGCTTFFSTCQQPYTSSGTLTFPGCTSTNPVTLFVCYSTNSGGSYVYQPLVTVNYISDPEAQKVTLITPNIIGIGSFVTVTINRADNGTGNAFQIGFTTGACATCNTTCEGLTVITNNTLVLKPFVTVQGVWQVCYTTSGGQSWSQQVNAGATMRTISALPTSISSISPSVVGQTSTKLYTIAGVVGSLTSYIAFSPSPSNCASVTLATNVPVGATTLTLTTTGMVGTYSMCYSTNFTNTWVRQTSVTLAVAVATPTSISFVSPTYRLGVGFFTSLTMTMASDTMSIDSQIAVGTGSSCTAVTNAVSIWPGPTAVLPITATLAAGVRPLCFTTGAGGWIQQTLVNLTMFAATNTSIIAISPQIIGVNTLPAITFTGATLLSTAYVNFVVNTYDCGFSEKSYGLTNLAVSTTQILNQAIVLGATQPLYLCYTTNYGVASPTWVPQITPLLNLTVVRALTTSLISITPSTVSANVQLTLTMPLTDVFPVGSFISFSSQFGSCATRYLQTAYVSSSVTLSANFSTSGVYYVCYTVDSGANWVAQAPALTVILGSPTSISSVSPAYIGTNTTVTLTLGGVIATQHTRIAFSLSMACTSMLNNVAYPVAPTITPAQFVAPGNYYVCYSTDAGATWSAQTIAAAILHVLDARPNSVLTMSPGFFASGISQVLTLSGDQLTPQAYVSLAANETCGTGPYYGVTPYGTSVTTTGAPSAGVYQLCYSVDNKQTWVGQPHVVEALYPSPYFLSGVRPQSFGANTIPSIEINRTESRVTPQARLAWVLEASGDCNNAGDRQAQMTLTSSNAFALPAVILTGGIYVGCITFNNADWVKQSLNASFLVIAGSPTSVSTITPRVFQNGEDARVTLTGVAFTTTSMLAFAKTGRCNDPTGRQAVTPWIPDEESSVSLASIIDTGEAYSTLYLCYSVDNGQTYYEQSNCSVTVLTKCNQLFDCGGCHQNPFCTWCLGESLCIKEEDADANCTSPVTPDDTSGCPVLSFPSRMSGSNAGFSNVSLGSNGKFLESDQLRCHWDFVTFSNDTVLNVLSPSTAWCYSPPAPAGVPSGFLSVYYNGKIYASGTRPWTFYNCNQRISNLCTDCYTTSKPECGTCFENNACQPSFQCSGLWGGTQCPSISELEPSQLNFRGGWVNVTGNLFVNSTALTCQFVSAGVVQYANATWIDTNTVFCYAPQFDPNRVVQVTLNHHDLVYSRNGLPLLYIPDPVVAAVIQPPAPVEPNRVTVPLVTTIVVLVVVAAVLMVVFWNRRRKARLMLMPPDLTPALKEAIIYGEPKGPANTKNVAPYTNDLIELLMVPNSPIINVLAKVCESTESDNMSRAMVFVCESRRRTVEVMKQLVSMEVQAAESMSTLFRTNSFVTKMFKTYSKVAGLEYLHATLGYELNASLHAAKGDGEEEGPGLDVKDDSNEDVQLNKLILLTVCQRVFLAVTKNEKEVPHEFRELFLHVKTCMQNKFPAVSGYLAKLTASNLSASLVETTNSINDGERALSVQELSALQSKLLTSVTGGATDASMQGQITQLTANIEVLNTQLAATLKSCRDMEASFNPDSEAAKRVLVEHNQAQNAIACGGFFFLRFLVPAITAPDSYALMREAPDANKIKTLVLCGKVLQNLSNDKEMGGKEAHMAKMNEFIISNRRQMQKFQSNLMTKRPVVEAGVTVESAAVPVPARHLEAASAYMYDFIAMRLKNIMAQLDAPAAPGEDDKAVNMRAQMANMLMHVMGTINTKAGDYASVPKNADNSHAAITEARKSLQQTSMATMKTIRTDDSSASPEPISLESATTDSGAGMFAAPPAAAASTGSMASFNSKQTGGINFATLNNDLMTINPVFPTNDSVSSFGGPAPMLNTAESEMLRTISQPAGPPPPQPSIAPPPEFMSFRASDGDLFG